MKVFAITGSHGLGTSHEWGDIERALTARDLPREGDEEVEGAFAKMVISRRMSNSDYSSGHHLR